MDSEKLLRLQEQMREEKRIAAERVSKKVLREQERLKLKKERLRRIAKNREKSLEKNRVWAMTPEDPLYEMLPNPEILADVKWMPRQTWQHPELLRGPGPKKPSAYGTQEEFIREYLLDDRKIACDRKGKTKFEQIIENLFEIATSKVPQAKACAELLLERGFGKTKPSDEELDAKKRTGYQIIVMPQGKLNIPTEELALPAPPEPDFIDADFTEVQ